MDNIDGLDLSLKESDIVHYYMSEYKTKITTLNNLGNTCFFNSFIQCLVHTDNFVNVLFRMKKNAQNSKNKIFLDAFLELVEMMHDHSKPYNISPKRFLNYFYNRINKKNLDQEDAHEMMFMLLDTLHEITSYQKIS